jgi:hypothetical protein
MSLNKFTYSKRLGLVNKNIATCEEKGGSPGIKIDGKYWCTNQGKLAIYPDYLADSSSVAGGFVLESLPDKLPQHIKEAIGANDEIIKLD